jgi:RNA polymerase sigma factor (sigma-70 family)
LAASTCNGLDAAALARRWAIAEAERSTLVRIARRAGLTDLDAEDCVQEAILKVVPRAGVDESRMAGLLVTVVRRRAIDIHRRAQAAARASKRLQAVAPCDADTPDVLLCDRAEAEWSATVVEQLPAFQRQVLMARADGRSWNEIAHDLSTTVKAVESAVSRARASVRLALASTLGIAIALARRWRQSSTTVVGGTTAVVLIAAVTAPLLHRRDSPEPPAPRGEAAVRELAEPASTTTPAAAAATGGLARPGTAPAGDPTAVVAPPSPTARTTTVATFSTPVTPNGKLTRNDDKEDTVSRVRRCFLEGEYHVEITPSEELGEKPRVDARCEGDPDPK